MKLVLINVSPFKDATPYAIMSAEFDERMKNPLSGDKLRNIREKFEFFMPRERCHELLTNVIIDEDENKMIGMILKLHHSMLNSNKHV